jgi:quercetin dioxygenase-like cupin family protein
VISGLSAVRGGVMVGALMCLLVACQGPRVQATSARLAGHGATLGAGSSGIRRVLLGSHDLQGIPGWELRVYLIEYPPGVAAEPHVHPSAGVGYVLEGAFESAFGDDAPTSKGEGESFVDEASIPHRLFRNASASRALRFIVAYAMPRGAPTLKPL